MKPLIHMLPCLATFETASPHFHSISVDRVELIGEGYLSRHHPDVLVDDVGGYDPDCLFPDSDLHAALQIIDAADASQQIRKIVLRGITQRFGTPHQPSWNHDVHAYKATTALREVHELELHLSLGHMPDTDYYAATNLDEESFPVWHEDDVHESDRWFTRDFSRTLTFALRSVCLKRLHIRMTPQDDALASIVANRSTWTSQKYTWAANNWPALESLSLKRAMIDADDLGMFLRKHAPCLRNVDLNDLQMQSDPARSWRILIKSLAVLSLTSVTLSNSSIEYEAPHSRKVLCPPFDVKNKADDRHDSPPHLRHYLLGQGPWSEDLEQWLERDT